MSDWNALPNRPGCQHCWHQHRGPIWIVLHDGETVQSCCRCHGTRVVHADHAHTFGGRQ